FSLSIPGPPPLLTLFPYPTLFRSAIDIVLGSQLWRSEPNAAAVIRRAIGEAAEAAGATAGPGEVAVMLCDDAAMRELNGRWRGGGRKSTPLNSTHWTTSYARLCLK